MNILPRYPRIMSMHPWYPRITTSFACILQKCMLQSVQTHRVRDQYIESNSVMQAANCEQDTLKGPMNTT